MYQNSGGGILSFIKSIDIPAFLDGTSKTLNVINQAIPVFYQVKPILGNVGTLFKISNAINSGGDNSGNAIESKNNVSSKTADTKTHNSPVFYV